MATRGAFLQEDWSSADALWLRLRMLLSGLARLELQGSFWLPHAARLIDEMWDQYVDFCVSREGE